MSPDGISGKPLKDILGITRNKFKYRQDEFIVYAGRWIKLFIDIVWSISWFVTAIIFSFFIKQLFPLLVWAGISIDLLYAPVLLLKIIGGLILILLTCVVFGYAIGLFSAQQEPATTKAPPVTGQLGKAPFDIIATHVGMNEEEVTRADQRAATTFANKKGIIQSIVIFFKSVSTTIINSFKSISKLNASILWYFIAWGVSFLIIVWRYYFHNSEQQSFPIRFVFWVIDTARAIPSYILAQIQEVFIVQAIFDDIYNVIVEYIKGLNTFAMAAYIFALALLIAIAVLVYKAIKRLFKTSDS